ncbi:MAG: dihydrolipoamide acetyltransferase family protein [Bacteroidota bacterium]
MTDFKMPSLGADMDNGTLSAWRVKPGDKVKRGDIIGDVETAKGVIEMECFEDGVVDELLIQPGTEVPVGTVIARICTEAELATPGLPKQIAVPARAAAAEAPAPPIAPAAVAVAEAPAPSPVVETPAAPEHARISPLARKVAADLHVDLKNVKGTGPGGAIVRSDIERAVKELKIAAPSPVPAPTPAPVAAAPAPVAAPVPPAPAPAPIAAATAPAPAPPAAPARDFSTAMRQAIAAAMSKSNREIPHYYLETHIDMKRTLQWLEEENARRTMKERFLPVVPLLKATALALVDNPQLNGFWIDDHLEVSEAINIGFAVALRTGGLVTPAIHSVDLMSLDELRDAVSDLIVRTRAGRLKSSEMTDSTIVFTSLGDRGVEKVFGVIYPPQVALVGFGKVIDQPWVENGMIGVRPAIIATLAGDHRASDGHRGALFLESLNMHLQEPEKL